MKNNKILLVLTILMGLQSQNSSGMGYASRLGRNLGMAAAAAYAGSSFTSRVKCESASNLQGFKSSTDLLVKHADDLVSRYEHEEYLRQAQDWAVAEGERAAAARLAQPKVFDEKATRVLTDLNWYKYKEIIRSQYGIEVDSREAALRYLFNIGANINAKDFFGKTVLMHPWLLGQDDIFESFLELGPDLNAQDDTGKTALHHAAMTFDRGLVKKLLKAGARPDIRDNSGAMAICYLRDKEIFDYFIAADFDINLKNDEGRSLFFYTRSEESFEKLVELGLDVKAKDKNGKNLLHCDPFPFRLIARLIELGVDLYAVDNNGETPLDHKEVRDAAYKLGKISTEVYEELEAKAKANKKAKAKANKEAKAKKKEAKSKAKEEAKDFSAMISTPIGQAWQDLERYCLESN